MAPWHRTWLALAVIVLAGTLAYSNSFQAPFVLDGVGFITQNPAVRTLNFWEQGRGGNRPVGFLTFALNYALAGPEAWGYHAVNLAIHLTAAWVLFALVRDTLSSERLAERYGKASNGIALASALLWLLHPLQTESVTYVYQRLESLMSLFYLLTLYAFVCAQRSRHPRWWYAASVAACALGMGCKEVMVTAPLLVLWYDRVFIANSWRELFGKRSKYYAALASTWGILAVLMWLARDEYGPSGVLMVEGVSPIQYAATQPGVILHYLRLMFWPDRLCFDYDWRVADAPGDIVPPALVIGILVLLSAWSMFRWPALGFLAGAFFFVLAPTSSMAPLKDLAFEHRMYLPLAPLVILAVLAVHWTWQAATTSRSQRSSRGAFYLLPMLVVGLIATALGIRTFARNADYQSAMSIWTDTLEQRPDNARAHVNLARELLDELRASEALPHLDRALELNPSYVRAYINRGLAYGALNRYRDAIADFDQALARGPAEAPTFRNRAACYDALKEYPAAIQDLTEAVDLRPDYADAYFLRARVYQKMNKLEQAAADYTHVIDLRPNDPRAYTNRGNCYRALGRRGEAAADYNKARQLNPSGQK